MLVRLFRPAPWPQRLPWRTWWKRRESNPLTTSEAALVTLSVDKVGSLPSLLADWLQASGPLVERLPQTWLRAGELNATRMAYEASMTPVHLPAENFFREAGSNQQPLDYRSSAQTTLSFFPDGAPCQIRTDFSGVQVRRIADYAYRA